MFSIIYPILSFNPKYKVISCIEPSKLELFKCDPRVTRCNTYLKITYPKFNRIE